MSQRDEQTKKIGKHSFTVFKLPWDKGQDVLIDISQTIVPAIGKAAGAAGALAKEDQDIENILDSDIDISEVLSSLMVGLSKERMRSLVETMASVTRCNGKELENIMEIFRGDLPLMYEWLAFALEVNFANFFAWVGGAIKSALNKKREASESQPTSGATG